MRTMSFFISIAGVGLVMAGCQGSDIEIPSVSDITPALSAAPLAPGQTNVFRALVQDHGWKITGVFVRFTRHRWPEQASQAHLGEALQTDSGVYEFALPAGQSNNFRTGDAVFRQWLVEYQLQGQQDETDVLTRQSSVIRTLASCTDEAERAAMAADEAFIVSQYAIANPHLTMLGTHGFVSLRDSGVVFLPPDVTMLLDVYNDADPTINKPALLLYAPRPKLSSESDQQYLAAITDQMPDPPYTLIGWAYGKLLDPAQRPILNGACVGSDKWFVHEAGFHLADGGMQLTLPDEDVPGSVAAPLVPPPGGPALGVYHPRVWDLHVWRSPGGSPVVQPSTPFSQPGLTLPNATFFPAETFD